MTAVSQDTVRNPLSPDSPCGPNLEYDARFVEMQRLAEGTREQQYGDTIIPASPPDWRGIGRLAEELARETKDIRVAVLLTESRTHLSGLDGLCEGLQLLQTWICDYWDSIHPQLDEADDNDPFIRINGLARLCERDRLPSLIGKITLAEAPPHITVTLDAAHATVGEGSRVEQLTAAEIEAAFLSVPLNDLRRRYEIAQRSEQSLAEVFDFLEDKAGVGIWDAQTLVERMNQCVEILKDNLRRRLTVSDAAVTDLSRLNAEAQTKQPSATNRRIDSAATHPVAREDRGSIRSDAALEAFSGLQVCSRRDAEHVLEAVIRYFETQEPSSPVPLLLRRAKRLMNRGFVDILRELAPDALVQAKSLTGEDDERVDK